MVTDSSGTVQEIEVLNKTRTSQLESAEKYESKFDNVRLRVPEGTNDKMKAYAKAHGYSSVNAWLNELIQKELEK